MKQRKGKEGKKKVITTEPKLQFAKHVRIKLLTSESRKHAINKAA